MRILFLSILAAVFVNSCAINNMAYSRGNIAQQKRLNYGTPQMFGAKGDGITNDTKAFQKCIEASDSVYVPAGHYIVTLQHRRDPSIRNGIVIDRSNVKLIFSKDAVMQGVIDSSVPKPTTGYDFQYNDYNGCIIWIRGDANKFIENVVVEGGTFVGVRSDFGMNESHTVDESGNGIRIHYTKNTTIKNCTIKDNQGDNILAYYNKNLTIESVESYDCRRTGISVGPCEGFIINSCRFYNNGCDKAYSGRMNYATSPMNAVCLEGDIQADAPLRTFKKVVIKNCYSESKGLNVGSEKYKFVGRNIPGFVEIGQLADGGDQIVIENNKVEQEGSGVGAINIHVDKSPVKKISVIHNEFTFKKKQQPLSSTSNHLLVLNGNLVFWRYEITDTQTMCGLCIFTSHTLMLPSRMLQLKRMCQ